MLLVQECLSWVAIKRYQSFSVGDATVFEGHATIVCAVSQLLCIISRATGVVTSVFAGSFLQKFSSFDWRDYCLSSMGLLLIFSSIRWSPAGFKSHLLAFSPCREVWYFVWRQMRWPWSFTLWPPVPCSPFSSCFPPEWSSHLSSSLVMFNLL